MSILDFFFDSKKINRYLAMTSDQLSALTDTELYEAIGYRAERAMKESFESGVDKGVATDEQIIFFSLNTFDMEIQNGGLCQFFVNSSRAFASTLSEALEVVGALPYKELYDRFIADNGIDLDDLDAFDIDDVNDYAEKTKLYPFDDFDDRYYELYQSDPLSAYLVKFVRDNLNDF